MMKRLPLLLSVPHGGTEVPPECRGLVDLDAAEIATDSDTWTRELFSFRDEVEVCLDTPIARVFVDVNRAGCGQWDSGPGGAVRERTQNGKRVWKDGAPDPAIVAELLRRYHAPYHREIDRVLETGAVRLGLDCHAMVHRKRCPETGRRRPRPVFCISNRGLPGGDPGGEPLTAPGDLVRRLGGLLSEHFSDMVDFETDALVRINEPFRGGYIIASHGRPGRVPFVQLEVNRALFVPPVQEPGPAPRGLQADRLLRVRNRLLAVFERISEELETVQ